MSDTLKNIKETLELLEKRWHKHSGLLIAEVIGITLITTILPTISPANIISTTICYAILILGILFLWLYSNRCPKTKKGKVGFAICISCSNDQEREKIREDFIITLEHLIKRGNIGNTFHVITIPDHISEKINDDESAHLLRQKCKAHFFL